MAFLEHTMAFLLFSLESYNVFGHLMVLFRIRLLPRKDLARLRIYFLVELLTVFVSSFLLLQKLRWLAIIQVLQHTYYLVMWEKTDPAKELLSWASIDWVRSNYYSEWHLQKYIGLLFDVAVHSAMAFYLSYYLTIVQIISGLCLGLAALLVVVFSPKYAWSYPWSVPKWIEKRIEPISGNKA